MVNEILALLRLADSLDQKGFYKEADQAEDITKNFHNTPIGYVEKSQQTVLEELKDELREAEWAHNGSKVRVKSLRDEFERVRTEVVDNKYTRERGLKELEEINKKLDIVLEEESKNKDWLDNTRLVYDHEVALSQGLLRKAATKELEEYHIPDIKVEGKKVSVQVGKKLHPSEQKHHIEWIKCYVDGKLVEQKELKVPEKPIAEFNIESGSIVKIVIKCNIHGVWENEAKL